MCFFCLSLFCEHGDYQGEDPHDGMTDGQLEGIVVNGSEEQSATASQLLNDRKRAQRIADLQKRISELLSEVDSIVTNHNTESDMGEIASELNELTAELVMLEKENAEAKKENKEASEDKLAEKDSATAGDPVKASVGTYMQTETDIQSGMFEVKRKYESNDKIISSLGYGWTFNLDQRIILGTEPGLDKIMETLTGDYMMLYFKEKNYKAKIIKDFKVTGLDTGLNELKAKLTACDSLEKDARALDHESNGDVDVSPVFSAIDAKRTAIRKDISDFEKAKERLELIHQKKEEIESLSRKYEEEIIPKNNLRKEQNSKVMFEGSASYYEENGFDTITIIDEDGNPHVFYESENETDVWNNKDDLNYIECRKIDNQYELIQSDGIEKIFNEDGLLIKITDRNGNYEIINRKPEGKIKNVITSFGEKYDFEYSGNFIKKITNVRAPEENIVYSYTGNKLTSVKDTDGDSVVMEYNPSGKLSALKKCDGSKVRFSYEVETAGGKLLATSTTNEEGFSESFQYDLSGMRTDYIDHDGNRTIYFYDDKHRTLREIHSDGSEIINEYDEAGNLKSTNENGYVIEYKYDKNGNKISAAYEDGSAEFWSYDNHNLIRSYTDRDSVREDYIRDSKGNIIEYKKGNKTVYINEINEKGQIKASTSFGQQSYKTFYTYDDFGNVICEICGGRKTEYSYDNRNRLTCIKLNGKIQTEYKYEPHKVTEKTVKGLQTVYLYNGRKDLIRVTQKDTVTGVIHDMGIEYDKRHLPLRAYSGDGKIQNLIKSYIYTEAGKLKAEVFYGKKYKIKNYEYKNGFIHKIIEFSADRMEGTAEPITSYQQIKQMLVAAGNDFVSCEYNYVHQNDNGMLLTITDGLGIKNSFEYDSTGKLVSTINGNGEKQQKKYSKAGRLEGEQSLYGGWYEYNFAYERNGLLVQTKEKEGSASGIYYYPDQSINTITDCYGNVSKYYYDNLERVISINNGKSRKEFDYDIYDRLIKESLYDTENGASCVYFKTIDYSEDGRKIIITEGGKYKTELYYDGFGNLLKRIDGNGNTKTYEYDYLNNMIAAYDGYGNKTSYEYNAFGNIKKIIYPDESTRNYEYNDFNQLQKITDDNGIVYSASYDKNGRLIKERSIADVEKSYEYDKAGRLVKIFSGGELVQSYSYNNQGRNVTVKDGNENAYQYTYDSFGRLTNEQNRKALNQKYYYDEGGQLKNRNNFDGSVISNLYSKDRRVQTVRYSDGSQNYFEYDVSGNLINIKNEYENTLYQYDKGNKLIYQKNEETGEEIFYEYDEAGNRIRLKSSGNDIIYQYGKNNEIKEIFDNKQRVNVILEYNKNGREILRQFGNGIKEETLYDSSGRINVKIQKTERGQLLWGEGYVYGPDGKRIATVDNNGCITLYEYDNQGRLKTIYYPYTNEYDQQIKKEAEENGLYSVTSSVENQFLSADLRNKLIPLMNEMQYGLAFKLTNLQLFIKESFCYDRNGNRISKTTPYGTIEYSYNKENCMISSGSGGRIFITYTYDEMGNLLTETSALKRIKYAYNSQNRLIFCEVTNEAEKTYLQTSYAYDALGRRILVQDAGESLLRTVYDGLSFDVLKQGPVFANSLFTDSLEKGIHWGKSGKPTGDRYRYIEDSDAKDNNRYVYIDGCNYKSVSSRYQGERFQFSVNGLILAQTTSENGPQYFTTDLLGSVRSSTDKSGLQNASYTYDAFGSLVQGNFTASSDFGYLGKQHDPTSALYNYGFRDYSPLNSRFTTQDPIRDGTNWFAYCNGDPVNFVDLLGLFFYRGNEQNSITTVKKTTVVILRNDDGNGNEFDSSRLIYKNDGIDTKLVYVDEVGANCKTEYDGTKGSTTPDGIYYLSNSILNQQSDGSFDSESYSNVLSLMTNDQNLTQEQREMINTGDRLFHANQFSTALAPYNSNLEPGGAGCIISKNGQIQHNLMMEYLMDGVINPESITVLIKSMNHVGCGK